MENIRIGIIGTGIIGKFHVETYKKIKGAEVVAICDINKEEVDRVSKEYDIPQTYRDYNEMLKCKEIDAVDICLHNNLHMCATIAALEAGKHVYCEKPIAGSYIDGKKMVDKAKECGKMLQVQLSHVIFSRETKTAKLLIDSNKLGNIYHARSTGYRRLGRCYVDGFVTPNFAQKKIAGGGALIDKGVYHISRIMYLLGNPEPMRISGKTYQEIAMDPVRRRECNFDVEELAVGFVRLKGNITLDIIESWAINLDEFEPGSIVGSKGGLRLEPLSYYTNFNDTIPMDSTFALESVKLIGDDTDDPRALRQGQFHWIDVLTHKVDPVPTAEIALNALLISEGIYLSEQLGREVTAEEVIEKSVSTAI